MDRFVEKMQQGIEQGLLRALFLARLIGVGIWLAGLISAPWIWKLILYGPFFLAPALVALTRILPPGCTGPDQAAFAAELRRIRNLP